MTVRVVTAADAAAADAAAISEGVPPRALMRVAASNAATVICERFADRMGAGVLVATGAGNNGGDGWALARCLAAAGVPVRVLSAAEPRTPDSRAERALAQPLVTLVRDAADECRAETLVVDALLGTGAHGAPDGDLRAVIARVNSMRAAGATVVALDAPTGLDATSGACANCVHADLTITFGTLKRGLVISRELCGEIVVVDIGLHLNADVLTRSPALVDADMVARIVPPIAADANKGTRKHLAIIAGGEHVAGAAILAADAALRSGAGLVKVITHPANITAVQARLPAALAAPLPATDDDVRAAVVGWADAVLIGPGLGRSRGAVQLVRDVLRMWRGPILLDADALNAFEADVARLASALDGRSAVITPHPLELSRLVGVPLSEVLAGRFDIGGTLAARLGATVLLKGTPTVITAPDGTRLVSAAGTAALATGGTGDALGGSIATFLAQGAAPADAAAAGAWVHGRAAELAHGVRGVTVEHVLGNLSAAWRVRTPASRYPALATLPAVRS